MRWKSNEFEVARAIWLMQKPKKRNLWFCCLPTYATFSRSITFSFIRLLSTTASWRCSPRPMIVNIVHVINIRIYKTIAGNSKNSEIFQSCNFYTGQTIKVYYNLKRNWISWMRRSQRMVGRIRGFVVLCYVQVFIKFLYYA